MTYRFPAFVLSLSLLAAGCSSSTTPSTTADPKFSAGLLASNEVPAVTNADSTATGTVTVTLHTTKDGSGNITAATADFSVTLQGFPANTTITAAHIHPGVAGSNGSPIWNLLLVAGEIPVVNGSATITKSGLTPSDIVHAQALINNPASYYFNVHTSLNSGGAVRGQLARIN